MLRQLTAILFTDAAGYADLMHHDEEQGGRLRERQREVLERLVPRHHGRTLESYGDGTLNIFQSAVDACRCALELQRELRSDKALRLRVGIHTGDLVHDGEGVFGDGVNVAARIHGIAVPGSVLLSEKVYDEVRNQSGIRARSMGEFHLRNVRRPMEVYALVDDDLVVPSEPAASETRRQLGSVAVLPFANVSSDPANEFFSDGVTEEIINALTRVNGLQVTARTSSFAFKNRSADVRGIASELGVEHVLEGSVRRAGERVRISAQLVDAKSGYQVFSETYDRHLQDIFETQDEIARRIAEGLEASLGGRGRAGEPAPLVRERTDDTEAYTLYLEGLAHWNRWTPAGVHLAIEHYRRAIAVDPGFPPPYAHLSAAYAFLGVKGYMPPREAFPRARKAAERALELEETGEAHTALAAVKLFHDWDFEAAYRSLQKALTLTPGSAEVHHVYGLHLKATGELDEAIEEMETAVQLDPLSVLVNRTLGSVYHAAGRNDEALARLERTLELEPGFQAGLDTLGWIQVSRGDLGAAEEAFESLARVSEDPVVGAAQRGFVYARTGRADEARRMLEALERRAEEDPAHLLHLDLAVLHLGLRDRDGAIRHLERAVEDRLGDVVFLGTSPDWEELRGDARFERILDEVGLPRAGGSR